MDQGDPTTGGGPDPWEAAVRAKCSEQCAELNVNYMDMYDPHCEDEDWSEIERIFDEVWGVWKTCPVPTTLLDFDLIETVFGAAAAADAEQLPCDLALDCSDYLDYDEKLGLWTPPDANTRYTADVLLESDPGESFFIINTVNRTAEGHAAYTATSCGEDACPFYLAQMELTATSSMTFNLSVETATLTKTISDLNVKLARPTLGMWLPASGYVIIPPKSLSVTVEATVSGSTNTFGENGAHEVTYIVDEYTFGIIDGANLLLGVNSTDYLGTWSVTGQFIEE
ncbi:hypothetical protein OV090_33630 [Nannocystis sp. RBIL2]|uniref:hypothetical protein n=1 Tax=Nannocystis sp. RBIL2 TaxID=2996788 RepID=UPI002271F4D6|nr:hypothetical protein [Nannocystis sp. RBIL2]MCY1069731.1 hypothetical protein [Nannocystis sp. RBIL2]